jgi:hypothetical protein
MIPDEKCYHLTPLEIHSKMRDKRIGSQNPFSNPLNPPLVKRGEGGFNTMKKLQPGDEVIKIDEELGIAWILLPPDEGLGGFRGISPRVMNEEKFLASKKGEGEKG